VPARRHQAPHALDAPLAEGERAGEGIERDAETLAHLVVDAQLTGRFVQPQTVQHRHEQPRADVLYPLRRPHRLRVQRYRRAVPLGRCRVRARSRGRRRRHLIALGRG
jgi:hypothetical protein